MNERFKHECDEWDGLVISENDLEFTACSCFEGPEFEAARNKQSNELDRLNHLSTIRELLAENKKLRVMVARYADIAACLDTGEGGNIVSVVETMRVDEANDGRDSQ